MANLNLKLKSLTLALVPLLPALLVGCGGGGENLTNAAPNISPLPQGPVTPTPPTNNNNNGSTPSQPSNPSNPTPQPNNPTPQPPEEVEALTTPAPGFILTGKRRPTDPVSDPDYENDREKIEREKDGYIYLYNGVKEHRPDGMGQGKNQRQELKPSDIKPLANENYPEGWNPDFQSDTLQITDPSKTEVFGYGKLTSPNGKSTNISATAREDYQYIRFGYLSSSNAIRKDGITDREDKAPLPALFYHGEHTANSLPSAGKVKYTGQWLYLSDVKKRPNIGGKDPRSGADFEISGNHGDVISAAHTNIDGSKNKQTPANYDVDFDKNELKGTLSYYEHPFESDGNGGYRPNKVDTSQQINQADIYQIDATITDNRFKGNAKSLLTEENLNNKPYREFLKQLFSKHANPNQPNPDSSTLEGGFYGENGEELAGKFLSDDHSMFVVFGGKREDSTQQNQSNKKFFHTDGLIKPDSTALSKQKVFDQINNEQYSEEDEDGNIIKRRGLNAKVLELEDENEDFVPSHDEYDPFSIKDKDNFTQKIGNSQTNKPAYFGQVDKLFFAGKYFDLSTDQLSDNIKKDYPNATSRKDSKGIRHIDLVTYNAQTNTKAEFITVCCDNYSYMRFGEARLTNPQTQQYQTAYFLQGNATDRQTMPNQGKFSYTGHWAGYLINKSRSISKDINTLRQYGGEDYFFQADTTLVDANGQDIVYKKGDIKPEYKDKWLPIQSNVSERNFYLEKKENTARFDVDFNTNKLTGSLKDKDQNTVFSIENGNIKDDASFTAKAIVGTRRETGEITGYAQEHGNNRNTYIHKIENIDVIGQFFGKDAAELGGTLHFDNGKDGIIDDAQKAGAIFGATKDNATP